MKIQTKTPPPATACVDGRELLIALSAFKKGDFAVRLPVDRTGIEGKVFDAINDIFEMNERMNGEVGKIGTVDGKESKIGQQASLGSPGGDWNECLEAVNGLIGDLVQPSTEISRVIGAVARGDLSQS